MCVRDLNTSIVPSWRRRKHGKAYVHHRVNILEEIATDNTEKRSDTNEIWDGGGFLFLSHLDLLKYTLVICEVTSAF